MQEQSIKLNEIIEDTLFHEKVKRFLRNATETRLSRPEPKPGFRYKRDWYDRMLEKKELNATFFIKNIGAIWIKESKLNSESRNIILYVCNQALEAYLNQKKPQKPLTK